METFDIDTARAEEALDPDYNVAPTKTSPVVLARRPKDSSDDTEPVRQLRNFTWGLVPSWSKEPKLGRMINARAETVHEKPAFRRSFASRRLIVPISGFYEWFTTEQVGKSGRRLKRPFYLHPKDGEVLALAGLYEFWRDDDKPSGDPDAWLTTFTIITTRATDDVGHIHDRMPMTVGSDDWRDWLDPRIGDPSRLRSLMAPPAPGSLDIYPVTTAVNKAENNGPELLDAIPPER